MELPQALRENCILFLTGAGASVPLGLPATHEFRQRFASVVASRFEGRDDDLVRFAISRLNAPGDPDIEQVLSLLENDSAAAARLASVDELVKPMTGDGSSIEEFKRRCDEVAEAIYAEVLQTYGNVDRGLASELYRGLIGVYQQAHDVTGGSNTLLLFTLNYDTSVEHAAGALGARLIDGFVAAPDGQRRWRPAPFAEYQPEPEKMNVILVKLHGSVRLGRRIGTAGQQELIELAEGMYRNPPPYEHVVLYPTLGPKPVTTIEPFRTGYRLLRRTLEHAYLLCAIGCSFRDEELNSLLSDSLDRNSDLRIVAINPELDHTSVAASIGCDEQRVAADQRRFEIEDPEILRAGKGQLINCVRRWTMTAASLPGSPTPHAFGTTVGPSE